VGFAITLLIKHAGKDRSVNGEILYAKMGENWRKQQKYSQLESWGTVANVAWEIVNPSSRHTWLNTAEHVDFSTFAPLSGKGAKSSLFHEYSLGVSTNRDSTVYGFQTEAVAEKVELFIKAYNTELERFRIAEGVEDLDAFLDYEAIQWSRNLKRHLKNLDIATFDKACIVDTVYRPFSRRLLYNADIAVDEPARTGGWANIGGNRVICVPTIGGRSHPWVFAAAAPVNLNLVSIDASQCFPFYRYAENGPGRRENISSIALQKFRNHYADNTVSKWNIFHATYAVLHHPEYRTRYAANLKRELPRIPFPPDFHTFAAAGRRLMELHIDYEKQPEYKLQQIEDEKAEVSFRVTRMRLNPKDRSELKYNDFLTLRGIPAAAFDYRLGNRSALEWVVDQYRVSTDPRSGITNDPNREDDPKYILRLVGQVITVSIETQQIITTLPSLHLGSEIDVPGGRHSVPSSNS